MERTGRITWRAVWRHRGAGEARVAPTSVRQIAAGVGLLVGGGALLDALVSSLALRGALGLALIGGVYLWTRRAQMQAALVSAVAADEPRRVYRAIAFAGAVAYPFVGNAHVAAIFGMTTALDLAVTDAYLRRSIRRKLGAYPAASVRA